jgi:hypothetical protein
MKKTLFITFIIISSISCAVKKKHIQEKQCNRVLKNDFRNIVSDQFNYLTENGTLTVNEVKFECVFSAMYTKKVMYDKFGLWNEEVYINSETRPNLVWNNIHLFDNDDTKFTIIARGIENPTTTYASIMVLDHKNNDLLSPTSKYKSKLINLFSQLIKNNNSKNKKFYDVYWKIVDPMVWKMNQKYN